MKILVVEDEVKIARAVKKGLEQEGFVVDLAHDGDQGLANIRADKYAVIILDRMMPGSIGGIGILQVMRKEENSTPVLFLTARDQTDDRIEGLNSGADDYLVKPFDFEELLARVRALIRRPEKIVADRLEFGDIVIDGISHEISRSGEVVHLTKKEFTIINYLLRNQKRVVSREELINNCWDFDADVLPNSVEVFITGIRKKLEKPFSGPKIIQTVRGVGYKINGFYSV